MSNLIRLTFLSHINKVSVEKISSFLPDKKPEFVII